MERNKQEEFNRRLINPDVYYYPNVNWDTIIADLEEVTELTPGRKRRYYTIPISFDIETTSFETPDGTKVACMYAFGWSINGHVILGREWYEAIEIYDKLVEIFEPKDTNRLLVYIQNLGYEFQFFAKRFSWQRVFALKERKPITALTTDYVEFRCSYMLSGFSLAKMGENLQKYKVKKLVGDLDYSLKRHHLTL